MTRFKSLDDFTPDEQVKFAEDGTIPTAHSGEDVAALEQAGWHPTAVDGEGRPRLLADVQAEETKARKKDKALSAEIDAIEGKSMDEIDAEIRGRRGGQPVED